MDLAAHVAHVGSRTRPLLADVWRQVVDVVRFAFGTLRRYFRLDVPVIVFAVAYLALFAPLVTRNTANPQLMAAYVNDEPFLTMGLEATLVPPYGNPGAYFDPENRASSDLPEHWAEMRYLNITYYGGALFDLAFPAYATLRALGAPPFPTGPIILRIVTLLAALLSLIVLYNIAKERGSRLAGIFAAAYMASDAYFLYYADFIHPDTLQMLFGLCAFVLAVAHIRVGSRTSVLALGLFCGIVQGTKSGGAWTIPMVLVAIGLAAGLNRTFVSRLLACGGAALVGFFITTPYAFIDTYYERSMRIAYNIVGTNSLQQKTTLYTWGHALYEYIGLTAALLVLLAVGRTIWSIQRRTPDHTLILGIVLALSQFLWYGGLGKLWHVPGYLILSFGLLAVFAYETLFAVIRGALFVAARRLRVAASAARVVWIAAVVVVAVVFASGRWFVPASWAVDQYTGKHSTVREANTWAIDHHVSANATIVADDLTYFDRQRFPHTRLWGGVLTWPEADRLHPDYIVLSSSLFGAGWMQNLIAKQHLARGNPDPYNVHLYQDLVATEKPGPTKARGVVLEKIVRPELPVEPSRIADLAAHCSALCNLGIVNLRTELGLAAIIEQRLRALHDAGTAPLAGPELRIYHVVREASKARRPATSRARR